MIKKLFRFLKSEDGPTAVEYAVMLALIVGMCVLAITSTGGSISMFWTNTGNDLSGAVNQ